MGPMNSSHLLGVVACVLLALQSAVADDLPILATEGQPLGANVTRVVQALDTLGRPLDGELKKKLEVADKARDAEALQKLLDPQVLLLVALNPESRVKVLRGPGPAQPIGW